MARRTVFVVVRRQMAYNDNWHDWTGAEQPVKAYRTRERAEAVAAELSAGTDPNRWRRDDGWGHVDPDHVVMEVEVEVEVPDGTTTGRLTGGRED